MDARPCEWMCGRVNGCATVEKGRNPSVRCGRHGGVRFTPTQLLDSDEFAPISNGLRKLEIRMGAMCNTGCFGASIYAVKRGLNNRSLKNKFPLRGFLLPVYAAFRMPMRHPLLAHLQKIECDVL
jgi:hypothetical protein